MIKTFSLGGDPFFSESCLIPSEFSKDPFQPTPDGNYKIKLLEPSSGFKQARILALMISGSYIKPESNNSN